MRKNQLRDKGLSMSQAQTISNLCNQAVRDIQMKLNMVNNAGKTIFYQGNTHTMVQKYPMPDDIKWWLEKVGTYSACQGMLMGNIKTKDAMLNELKNKQFISETPEPVHPNLELYNSIQPVNEEWGWEQLTSAEIAEYIQSDGMAAHIGQFIHKGGKLDMLRQELPQIPSMDWFRVNQTTGETVPVTVTIHHTTEQLWKHHEELAAIHREHEQKVNYYKAKVKNLVTAENARIAAENGTKQAEVNQKNQGLMDIYVKAMEEYNGKVRVEREEWEQKRQQDIQKTAALRIEIPDSYQSVIDEFLPKEEKDH